MKNRLAITLAVSVCFAVNAIANTQKNARCQGVLSGETRERITVAAVDPATTFQKAHRRGAKMPLEVRCESQLWQTQHQIFTREEGGLQPAPYINPEKKQRGQIITTGNGNGNGNAYGHQKDHGKPADIEIKKAGSSKADLRTLPHEIPVVIERPEREEPPLNPIMVEPDVEPDSSQIGTLSLPRLVPQVTTQAPPTIMNFNGLDFQHFGNGHPPDTNGDVGRDYFIQTINTSIGIFRKSDGVRVAGFSFNTFMRQGNFGNLCDTNNFGDPVVLYDTFEDRWIITDFAFQVSGGGVVNPPGAFQCIAASMTGDPVSGGWNFYSINTARGLGDYPKFGIWPDGLYMSANMFDYPAGGAFQTARAYAFNKMQMYAGSPTVQVVAFDIAGGDFTVIPSNARLQAGTPPSGSPNYYVSTWQFLNAVGVYEFHVDWNDVLLSTLPVPLWS